MYITVKALFTSKRVELIKKKEFIAITFNPDNKIFIVHIIFLISLALGLKFYPFYKAQIVFLKVDKSFISALSNYTSFMDFFSKNLAAKLPEHTKIKDYTIDIVKDSQLPYI